jgi:hypothetical protein
MMSQKNKHSIFSLILKIEGGLFGKRKGTRGRGEVG